MMEKQNNGNSYIRVLKYIKYFFRVLLICTISTIFSILMSRMDIGKESCLMLFLVGVLLVSLVTEGYIYGGIAAILSVFLFNYLFTLPLYSFHINSTQDFILIIFFLIASLIVSTMTSQLQDQTMRAKKNERTARLMYDITIGFLNVTGKENIVKKGIHYIHDYVGYDCYVKLDSEEKIFSSPNLPDYNEAHNKSVYIIPIKGLANPIGTMEIINENSAISTENEMIIKTIVYQMALVLDREFIYNERENFRIVVESERLKSTLLRSISHDLRTPLTGIKGASELILENYDNLDTKSIKKLVKDMNEESIWLINTVQNILNMTRISEGKLTINKDYEAVDDIINQALTHVPHVTSSGRLKVSVPKDILLIYVDGKLIVQVLVNLLENAYTHSGENSHIFLRAYQEENHVIFEVADDGIGIDPKIKDFIFDEFVTKSKNVADSSLGVGLGLSICKQILLAHNGTITAENRKTGGSIFKVILPMEEA